MFHRWAAPVLVLALWSITPKSAAGQSPAPRAAGATGKIGRPFPNPFNPEIFIPFTVGCSDGGQHVVSLRILNILAQAVAVPVLQSQGANAAATSSVPGSLVGQPLSNVKLGCGDFSAYWNGNYQGTTREAASGAYLVVVTVDGVAGPPIRIYNKK